MKFNYLKGFSTLICSVAFLQSAHIMAFDVDSLETISAFEYSSSSHELLEEPKLENFLSLDAENEETIARSKSSGKNSQPAQNLKSAQDLQKSIQENARKKSNSKVLAPIKIKETQCDNEDEFANYEINFQNVAFSEYLRFLSKLTNTNFIYDEADVDFTVSVVADSPTDLLSVRSALLQMLKVQGLTLSADGNNVVISKDESSLSLGTVVSEELGNICSAKEAVITRVFQLNNVNATKMANIVSSMISDTGLVEPSDETHHIVVTDTYSNVQKIADLLKSLDNPNAAFEIGLFHVTKSDIENISILAEKILKPIAGENPFEIVPQASANMIYVVSTPYVVQKALEVLKSLDTGQFDYEQMRAEGFVGNARFLIYKLQNHKGYQIQQTLQELGAELSGTGNFSEDLTTTINTAQWIESTNSLLFVGDQQSLKKVKELLEMLDAPLRQVFIEVLAVRTTINNSLTLGVEYGYRARASDRVSTVGSLLTTPSTNQAGQASKPSLFTEGLDRISGPNIPVPRTSSQLGFSSGVIGNVMFAGSNLFFDLAALVNALQQDSSTEVITNPKLVAQDTVPATFYVGSTRPFQTNSILQASGSQSGNFVTASVEYRQLGMTLTVTPYLGSGEMITLEIDQRTSDFVSNATGGGSSGGDNFAIVPVTTDSSLTTRVQVPNKHFLMLSGMIEDVKTRTKSAIPCLGGLPIVGELFGTMANSMQKDNLIIFIRPHIIDTVLELDQITEREDEFYRKKTKAGSFMRNSFELYNLK